MKKTLLLILSLIFVLSSCMISPYEKSETENTKQFSYDETSDNSSVSEEETNILQESKVEEYDDSILKEIYNGVLLRLKSGVVEAPSVSKTIDSDIYYDALPGLEALEMENQIEREKAKKILGEPLSTIGSGRVFVTWQYKTEDDNIITLTAQHIFDENMTYVFDEASLIDLKINIINESLNKSSITDIKKNELNNQLTELLKKQTTAKNIKYDKLFEYIEGYCGFEIPKIYDEGFVDALSNTLQTAFDDYKKLQSE